jgi:hypothetical protein
VVALGGSSSFGLNWLARGAEGHGFHRHALLVMMVYEFLTLERLRLQERAEQ